MRAGSATVSNTLFWSRPAAGCSTGVSCICCCGYDVIRSRDSRPGKEEWWIILADGYEDIRSVISHFSFLKNFYIIL